MLGGKVAPILPPSTSNLCQTEAKQVTQRTEYFNGSPRHPHEHSEQNKDKCAYKPTGPPMFLSTPGSSWLSLCCQRPCRDSGPIPIRLHPTGNTSSSSRGEDRSGSCSWAALPPKTPYSTLAEGGLFGVPSPLSGMLECCGHCRASQPMWGRQGAPGGAVGPPGLDVVAWVVERIAHHVCVGVV